MAASPEMTIESRPLVSLAESSDAELATVLSSGLRSDTRAALETVESESLPPGYVPAAHFDGALCETLRHKANQLAALAQRADSDPAAAKEVSLTVGMLFKRLRNEREPRTHSPLADHVRSLASERHESWRVPAYDVAQASESFDDLLARNDEALVAFAKSKSRGGPSDARTLVDEAWVDAWMAYWSEQATRRFRGLGRVKTLVCSAILNKLRGQGFEFGPSIDPHDPALEPLLPIESADTAPIENEELWRVFDEALTLLPPRRRLVVHLLYRFQLRKGRVAKLLNVGASAITNHFKEARPVLEEALAAKGYRINTWKLRGDPE